MNKSRIMDSNDEPFALCNDPPRPKCKPAEQVERPRQQTLFVGLRDLPGQTYLVPESNLKDD